MKFRGKQPLQIIFQLIVDVLGHFSFKNQLRHWALPLLMGLPLNREITVIAIPLDQRCRKLRREPAITL